MYVLLNQDVELVFHPSQRGWTEVWSLDAAGQQSETGTGKANKYQYKQLQGISEHRVNDNNNNNKNYNTTDLGESFTQDISGYIQYISS